MQRCAVFVDAGYHCVAAARLIAGRRSRHEVHLDLSLAADTLANLADVKLRLGQLRGSPPRQKGVDTLMVVNLIVLAQERSISDAVLVTGDEDMREAVAYAQQRGVRVHLVVAQDCPASWTLRHEADTVTMLMRDHFASFASPARGLA